MPDISLTANVYFVGPVTPVRNEESTAYYFPCVAIDEFEEDGEDVYDLTECWFIVHEVFTEEDLSRLKWGDRLLIVADVARCGLAESMFGDRFGWHVSTIELVSRDHKTFAETDIEIPLTVDLPQKAPDAPTRPADHELPLRDEDAADKEKSVSMVQ